MIAANALVKKLGKRSVNIALAESITCGLATSKLGVYKGVASILAGSVVCYTPEVKAGLLKVRKSTMDEYTCESQEVTDELAQNLASVIEAELHAAITGLASAGGSETKEKPVGTVFFSIFYKDQLYRERRLFRGTPSEIREKACNFLYNFISEVVDEN